MYFFKCKMCGGTVEFEQGATVGVCDSCGTKQTLPRLDDDKKANLYDRANHFRRNNEYDKAMGIYEQILAEDNTDAEAYWSLVLCRYGIEYVEDPATHKRVPTVNRAQYMSVSADEDYKSALKYADAYQRTIYEQEAKTIDEIQKGILEISSKEEPFDIFISYKETDESGRRTPDSVLANDLYHQLTNEGFKVFFSRITLEDKLGTAYEPYIFSALNSAKVMVVIGTKPEYFNAVWVKNEWSRYLALVKKSDGKKMLIPAYRDMDPYDLPEEFSHLQAQDMSKLGFMQDLIRGIKKIVQADEPKTVVKETVVVNGGSANVAPLLKRVFMFLEDSNWEEADEYCEKVLDQDPENAQAYLGKLMAELEVRKPEQLADCKTPFDKSINYQKVIRFGDEKLTKTLTGYIKHINERNEFDRKNGIYERAVRQMGEATAPDDFSKVRDAFQSIPGFKNADALAKKAETGRKEAMYNRAVMLMEKNEKNCYSDAIRNFTEIPDWKDSKKQIEVCNKRIEEITEEEKRERKENTYQKAIALMKKDSSSAYSKAIGLFQTISDWKDATEQIRCCEQRIAEIKAEAKAKVEAQKIAAKKAQNKHKAKIASMVLFLCALVCFFALLPTVIIPSSKYNSAMKLYNAGEYSKAAATFGTINYKDSAKKADECLFLAQKSSLVDIEIGQTIKFGSYEQDNNTKNGKEEIEWQVLAVENNKALLISKYALDCQQYNSDSNDVAWTSCTLRKWLNDAFLNSAFGTQHQELIVASTGSADKKPKYETDSGNDTTDKVFLLSIVEAEKYFSDDDARECVLTEYSKAIRNENKKKNSNVFNVWDRLLNKNNNSTWWYLRSPGSAQNLITSVNGNGSINYDSGNSYVGGVRPAMWINLE